MREKDDCCVLCGEPIPEGYGMVCLSCQKKHGHIVDSNSYPDSATLFMLLQIERTVHAETSRKLEKAEHDRARYKRRIGFIEARHSVLCREFHAAQKELEILRSAVNSLENILLQDERKDGEVNGCSCVQTE